MFWTDIARFLQYFKNLSNRFIILLILQDFNGIFAKYSLNITVLCGFDEFRDPACTQHGASCTAHIDKCKGRCIIGNSSSYQQFTAVSQKCTRRNCKRVARAWCLCIRDVLLDIMPHYDPVTILDSKSAHAYFGPHSAWIWTPDLSSIR